jgi:hypothetical protein
MALPTSPSARVWYAYHCLPRDEAGRLPSIRSVEDDNGVAHGTLNKLFEARAKLERTNHERVERIAAALRTTVDWLLYGKGVPPTSRIAPPPWPGPKKRTRSGTIRAAVGTKRNR